ncbi:Ulp1 protease family, C-terminal catalytic domain-containing protein [Cryptosporidium felis]|nr:Ulp1 protease family, C-terminal catalytic domain-containing protein [Cryptosporidium felis]
MKIRRSNNGNLPLKIMNNRQILSQYIFVNHGPYHYGRRPQLVDNIEEYRSSENIQALTNSYSRDWSYTNMTTFKEEESKQEFKQSGKMRYQEIKDRHEVIYCRNKDNSETLLKRSLEFIKTISGKNNHLEVLGSHLNSLALCERNLEDRKNEFRKLVYGSDDKYSDGKDIRHKSQHHKYPMEFCLKDLEKARSYLYNTKNMELVVAFNKKSNIELNVRLIQCLRPQKWLNDELINFYFSMLQERNDRRSSSSKLKFKVWHWNTFFYSKLANGEAGGSGYCYKNVSRWTQRKKIDLFDYDLILIPININNVHWTLGAVNLKLGYIQYFDSLGGSFQDHIGCRKMSDSFYENLNRYIQDEHLDKRKSEFPKKLEHFRIFKEPVPQQNNGSDCGVFTCMFAECLSDNRSFDFDPERIDEIREIMLIECIKNSID